MMCHLGDYKLFWTNNLSNKWANICKGYFKTTNMATECWEFYDCAVKYSSVQLKTQNTRRDAFLIVLE